MIKRRQAYKLSEYAHNTDVQGDQFGCLRHEHRLYHNKPWQMSGHYGSHWFSSYTFTKVAIHSTQLIGNCLLSWALCVIMLLNIASSLFLRHNLAHFGIPYLCLLNPNKSRPSEGNNQAIAIKDNFCWLKISHKYFYGWHVCNYLLLFNYVYSDGVRFAKGG